MLFRCSFGIFLIVVAISDAQDTNAPVLTPSFAVLFPDGEVIFKCNTTNAIVQWLINDSIILLPMFPPGVSIVNQTALRVNMSANATTYACGVPLPLSQVNASNNGILVLAAPPSIITNVIIDPQTVRVDRIVNDVSFTLNWNEPFTNFDPIVNYTITITCIIATKCPMIYIINGTSLDVNLITDLSVMNHNISITANNSIGESIATSRLIIVPGDVGMLNLTCAPVDNENHCSVMWDALMFGSDVIPATNSTLKYNVSYYVGNISSGSKTVDVPMVTINLPGVDSDVSVTVLAFNVFGFGEESNASDVISEITPSIILPTAPPSQSPGTMTPSMIPSTAPPSQPPVGASTDDVDNSGAIIGGVIGGICGAILVIILIILIVYCCMKQEKSNRPRNTPMTKNNIPLYDTVQDPEVSDMVKIEPNPAYQGLPPDHVKMETNPAYQVITSDQVNRKADTDLSSHSGRASISKQKPVGDVNYYEDIINDQINITMTKNPSYVVPRL